LIIYFYDEEEEVGEMRVKERFYLLAGERVDSVGGRGILE